MEAVKKLREIFDSVDAIPTTSESQECHACATCAAAVRRLRDQARALGDALLCGEPCERADAAQQTDVPPDAELRDAEQRHEQERLKMAGLIK